MTEALEVELSAEEMIDQLKPLGFVVERVSRETKAAADDLVVDGQFLTVDEGNPLHRLVIGFGDGASAVQTQVQVYQGPEARKLLEFTTQPPSLVARLAIDARFSAVSFTTS